MLSRVYTVLHNGLLSIYCSINWETLMKRFVDLANLGEFANRSNPILYSLNISRVKSFVDSWLSTFL